MTVFEIVNVVEIMQGFFGPVVIKMKIDHGNECTLFYVNINSQDGL